MDRLHRPAFLLLALGGLALLAPLATAQNPSPNADLAITKQASPNPVVVGEQTTFYLNVTNNGPRTHANNVVVNDVVPSAFSIVSMSAGCSATGNNVTCSLGNVTAGTPKSVTIVVQANTAGVHNNTARVTGSNTDNVQTNNAATATVRVVTAPPGGLACVAESGRIRLSWDAVSQATGYNVYRATGSGSFLLLTTTPGTGYNDTTVAPGQTYRYVVTSLSAGGESAPSAECTASAIPFFPSLLAAIGATGVVLAAAWALRRR